MKRAYDYLVVGGGSAGCVLAARLSENPDVSVALIEAGPTDRHPLIEIPIGIARIYANRLFDWGLETDAEPGLDGRRLAMHQGKVLGGSSSINFMAYSRGDRSDFDRWSRNGARGWSYEDVLPFYRRSECWQEGASAWRGASGPVATCRQRLDDSIVPALIEAAKLCGFANNPDVAAADISGFGDYMATIGKGRRASASTAYLAPARHRSNLIVFLGVQATRIIIAGGRATGIEAVRNGQVERWYAAREVIVTSGAFHTPKLLMLSGIGPAEHLRSHGIDVVADLPVGNNLQDHFVVENLYARRQSGRVQSELRLDRMTLHMLRARFLGTGFATTIPAGLWGFVRSTAAAESPDIEFMFRFSAPDGDLWFPGWRKRRPDAFALRPAILHPLSRGEVRLTSADSTAKVRVRLNALTHPHDLDSLRKGLRLSREIAAQAPLDPFRGEQLAPGPSVQSDADLDAYIRATAITVHHPVGTCAIGPVVAPDLRVHGVDGLRVADGSVMPDAISAHTNATVMMIAEKAADLLKRDIDGPVAR